MASSSQSEDMLRLRELTIHRILERYVGKKAPWVTAASSEGYGAYNNVSHDVIQYLEREVSDICPPKKFRGTDSMVI
jgi:hypothetical protein